MSDKNYMNYLELYAPFQNPVSLEQIRKPVEEYLKNINDRRIMCLDSMAGTGRAGHFLKERFDNIDIVFQDKNKQILSSETYKSVDQRICADSKALDFPNNYFNMVVCRGGLNNVAKSEYSLIINEYLRIIKEDGIIILQDHFAPTDESRDVINKLEVEIALLSHANSVVYVPTINELMQIINSLGGKILDVKNFNIRLPLKDRLSKKGLFSFDLSTIKGILDTQSEIGYEETKDDIIVIYPISTIVLSKNDFFR